MHQDWQSKIIVKHRPGAKINKIKITVAASEYIVTKYLPYMCVIKQRPLLILGSFCLFRVECKIAVNVNEWLINGRIIAC